MTSPLNRFKIKQGAALFKDESGVITFQVDDLLTGDTFDVNADSESVTVTVEDLPVVGDVKLTLRGDGLDRPGSAFMAAMDVLAWNRFDSISYVGIDGLDVALDRASAPILSSVIAAWPRFKVDSDKAIVGRALPDGRLFSYQYDMVSEVTMEDGSTVGFAIIAGDDVDCPLPVMVSLDCGHYKVDVDVPDSGGYDNVYKLASAVSMGKVSFDRVSLDDGAQDWWPSTVARLVRDKKN